MNTKNKQRAKLALAELEKELEVLSKEEMNILKGGGDGSTGWNDGSAFMESTGNQQNNCKPSCVFNAFDYLDGDRYDMCHYYNETKKNLGYEPGPNGEVKTVDISTIGSYGGFQVREMLSDEALSASTGWSIPGGNRIMMTFNTIDGSGKKVDHAVVVTGSEIQNGKRVIKYYDPTTGSTGIRDFHDRSALYEVIQK